MPTNFTEGQHAAEFLVSEANGTRSREVVTLLSGENLKAGAVLGKVTKAGTTVVAGDGGGKGDMGTVTLGAGAKVGVYTLTIIEPGSDAGDFTVEDPDGILIGAGTVAVEFDAGGLTFTLADGGTDYAAGDQITITVEAGSGKYKEYDPTNTDGSEKAVAILYDNTDASAADRKAVAVVRDAEVAAASLQWFTGASEGQITTGQADLAVVGIIAR